VKFQKVSMCITSAKMLLASILTTWKLKHRVTTSDFIMREGAKMCANEGMIVRTQTISTFTFTTGEKCGNVNCAFKLAREEN
jgi:hypothetical protein